MSAVWWVGEKMLLLVMMRSPERFAPVIPRNGVSPDGLIPYLFIVIILTLGKYQYINKYINKVVIMK